MYFRNIFRTQLVGTRACLFNPLQRVYRAEVAAIKPTRLLIIINIFISFTVAEHFRNTHLGSNVGGCGEASVSHHQEVCFIHKSTLPE